MTAVRVHAATAGRWLAEPHRRIRVVSVAVGLFWALFMLGRLFIGGTVGLADNSDGHRLLCQLGVAKTDLPPGQALWAYVTPGYEQHEWFGEACSAGGTGESYLSTQWFLLWLSKLLTPVFGFPGALDLRVLGIIMSVLFGLAVGLLTAALPLPVWARALVASGAALFTTDSAIAPYFVSPLSEPAAIVGMLLLIAALVRMLRRNHTTMLDLLLVAAATLWTVGAKPQTVTLLLGVLPAMLVRPVRVPWLSTKAATESSDDGRLRRVGVFVARRLPALVVCLAVTFGALQLFSASQVRWFNEIRAYNQVFRTILPDSPTPEQDLRDLGVDPDLARYTGSSLTDLTGATPAPLSYADFVAKVDQSAITGFYLTHPGRILSLADRGFDALTEARPGPLGNYLADSGEPPSAKENRVFLGGAMFTMLRPLRWVAFPALWLGSFLLGCWIAFHRRIGAAGRGLGWILITLSVNTVAQFVMVLFSDGAYDVTKQMIFAVYGTFLLFPALIAAVGAIDKLGRPDQFAGDQLLPGMGAPSAWRKAAPSV